MIVSSNLTCLAVLTVCSRIDATNSRNGRTARHDKLVTLALVIGRLWLSQDKVVHVKSKISSNTENKREMINTEEVENKSTKG